MTPAVPCRVVGCELHAQRSRVDCHPALCDHYALDAVALAWPRTGIAGPSPGMHDARRTFATEMSRRPGVSLRDVQRLLGHADLSTTQCYLGRYRSDAGSVAHRRGR